MNEKIKNYLIAYCEKQGWGITNKDLEEVLLEAKEIYSEIGSSHRWYDEKFVVVEIDGMLIGYNWYHITGDTSVQDMGLNLNMKSVCEVEKKQKIVDYYEKII